MKKSLYIVLLTVIIGNVSPLDTDSYEYIDRLGSLGVAQAPVIFEDSIIFTAPASYKKVGVAFANEGYAKIYWYKKLFVPIADTEPYDSTVKPPMPVPPTHEDSGILFYTHPIPPGVDRLEYRLIINGLWTVDPQNTKEVFDKRSGIRRSVLDLPKRGVLPASFTISSGVQPAAGKPVNFLYKTNPGEEVFLAGSFNGWDPFMYTMTETTPGVYTFALNLPRGTYQYVFFCRGERIPDPLNTNKVYYANGNIACSLAVL
jgi:hypothetical protein